MQKSPVAYASGDFYVNSFGLLSFFKKADYKKTSK